MIQGQASFVLVSNCEVCQEGNRDRVQGNEFDSRRVTFFCDVRQTFDLSEHSSSQPQNSNDE